MMILIKENFFRYIGDILDNISSDKLIIMLFRIDQKEQKLIR